MKVIHRPDSPERAHFIPSKRPDVFLHPHLLYAGSLERSPHWKETPHTHHFLEVVLVSSGRGGVTIGGADFELRKGDILIYNADVPHNENSTSDDPMEFYFFGANNINIPGLEADCLLAPEESPVLHCGAHLAGMRNYFSALVQESQSDERFSKEMTESLCRMILLLILRLLPPGNENPLVENGLFQEARKYIDENYAKISSVDAICKKLHVSHYYLDHVFKRFNEESPLQYIILKRLEMAKALLATTRLTVGQIALSCGFEDESYFFRKFKAFTGTTPRKFRQESNA
jgi:AraC-like DNA-binding protein/mannose-6-phosphate isomerase-like protein (cupin superfamily)